MEEPEGGLFEQGQAVQERLRYPPESAPQQPCASRWSVKRIRECFACYKHLSLSGVWKALRRAGIRWRAGRPQMYSPDPAYAQKVSRLLSALSAARRSPHEIVVLFLDEMTYCRWPDASADWCESALPPSRWQAVRENMNEDAFWERSMLTRVG